MWYVFSSIYKLHLDKAFPTFLFIPERWSTHFLCNSYSFFVGESGVGKTTFVNTLFTASIKDYKNPAKRHAKQLDRTVEIEITKAGK